MSHFRVKRQRLRKALIIVSFLLFPVTIFYLSPYLILEGAAKGKVVGSFISFALLFISSLVLGRAFCGWACPGAGLQEALFMVQDKKAKGGRYNWIKYFIWVPWVTVIAYLFINAGGIQSIEPLCKTKYGISVSAPVNYLIYYVVIALIVLPAIMCGRRGFCHYICWMAPFMVIGRRIRDAAGWPSLQLRSQVEKCGDCMTCSVNCPMSLDVNSMVRKGSMQNSECILCGTCADNCPESAIRYSFSTTERPQVGQ